MVWLDPVCDAFMSMFFNRFGTVLGGGYKGFVLGTAHHANDGPTGGATSVTQRLIDRIKSYIRLLNEMEMEWSFTDASDGACGSAGGGSRGFGLGNM